ncbi:hypothetical protein O181_027176 [Austropuccinia psidii MF-1]|uniref:Uncharacterized protein n=1 Tax=Austropuccinia psidii MF-1 TaxID=1389203 RepID=A0A9Q3CRZ9_9BASI|nr:hypothetical protein [Austropuccinia psidii MF-1]
MAQKGHLGPLRSVRALGPFWPKSNEAKRGQGENSPEPILAPNLNNPKNGQKDPRTQIVHFQLLASGDYQSPPAQVQQGSPSIQQKTSPSPMYSVPKDPGMVHIWYNIPLCTNFSQKSNGDAFRTILCLFNSSPQIHHPS